MTLKQTDIEALVQLFGESDWKEMHLTLGDEEMFLSKDPNAAGPATAVAAPPAPVAGPASPPDRAAPPPPSGGGVETAAAADRTGWVAIKAPNLGTFYRAPSPEADPYVTLGGQVTEETEVCLVEVMKLFTTIRAGMTGIVREIVAEDGEMVEFGATLMWIEPEV
ncbi:acetyl-CoA carboxylase biotin carboxyl carrier protein [Antarcticimicrobium luteum]|uniref:Biotin carboxyl carrier protein of acetyl-CoA carboxylase n=1 Tax=Antarcticimicrobium luteum TaxID=2547397 RepID=A0A4R5V1R0_9RHOB|nr:acetyl-CoA carboxylase biotin carboxyl carrier protein [Antarcticimicrobium luteum]TDK45703.1 acetyl-CoA carboxylase biotin carboxyl carrier protein [Antarcticimicrobium luteum]